jgi:transposase
MGVGRYLEMRLLPTARKLMTEAVKRGNPINIVAKIFGVSRQTVGFWVRGKNHRGNSRFLDKQRNTKESKITIEIELAILAMRTLFEWGTARIQQGLMNLPDFAKEALQNSVENVRLSRTAINNVLRKHKLNGYKRNDKKWKFFRAKKPNELWQLDPKGPFTVQGKKYYFVVCIDDYSRYMLFASQYDHMPSTREIASLLEKLPVKPENILTDNGNQFKKEWKKWCFFNCINPLFAHPYYPQDKGKVERAIRTISEEFIHLIVKFPEWLKGKINEYVEWYNKRRFHRGINDYPSNLYVKLET